MENFRLLVGVKNTIFGFLKKKIHLFEQAGYFDWTAVSTELAYVEGIYRGRRYLIPHIAGFFAPIYDVLVSYECKDPEVWNVFIRIYCSVNSGNWDGRLRKAAYFDFDFDDTIPINPCQDALHRADIRGLRFLLQCGIPYLRLEVEKPELPYIDAVSFEEFRAIGMDFGDNEIQRARSQKGTRGIIVKRTFNNTMNYLMGPSYRASCYQELGLDKDPSMAMQMSARGHYFSVFKGNIEDAECISQVPEKFREDIGNFQFHFNYIRCYRMVFNTIPEPIVTLSEIAAELQAYKVNNHRPDLVLDVLIQEFPKIFPECSGPITPRSLKHLSKCQVRQNIRMSHLFPKSILFPEAVRALPLPEPLKNYVLDIDDQCIHK